MELPTRFSSQGLSKLFTVFLLGTENAVGGITDIPEHLPVFILGTEKKAKRQKGKNIFKKRKKYKKYKKTKKIKQETKKNKKNKK